MSSSSPSTGSELPKINKFVGEAFGSTSNVRTIFAGSADDDLKRNHRVIMLIGPKTSGKADLIDFFCNYFYGATVDQPNRYHIANEQFDEGTPEKLISTYIFNDSRMRYRPIIIDTPGTEYHTEDDDMHLMEGWLNDNNRMRIDVIAIILSGVTRLTTHEELQLRKTIELLPVHVRSKLIVIVTESDGTPPAISLLRRLELQHARVFKINTACLFQKPQGDALAVSLRDTNWNMSYSNLDELFTYIRLTQPVTISGLAFEKDHFPGSIKDSSSEASSSFSSRQSSFRDSSPRQFPLRTQDISPPDSAVSFETVVHRNREIKFGNNLDVDSYRHLPPAGSSATTATREQDHPSSLEKNTTTTATTRKTVTSSYETTDMKDSDASKRGYPSILSDGVSSVPPPAPSSLPPPPPPPPASTSISGTSSQLDKKTGYSSSGVPSGLLEEIRNSSKVLGKGVDKPDMKDVVVVDYENGDSEVVILNHTKVVPTTSTTTTTTNATTRTEQITKRSSHHEYISTQYDDVPPRTPTEFPPAMNPIDRPYDLPASRNVSRRPPPVSSNIEVSERTGKTVSVSPANKDSVRIYSDETTPPPPAGTAPITKNVSSTYSTLVFMNDNGTWTSDKLKTYTPSNRPSGPETNPLTQESTSPRSPYSTTLTGQLREQDSPTKMADYQPLPYSSMLRSSDPYNSGSPGSEELGQLNRGYSQRTNKTESPQGDTLPVRYIYETASRNYVRSPSRQGREVDRRKRESRSLDAQRTRLEEESYYHSSGYVQVRQRSPLRHSTTSLHRLSRELPELIHSEDNYTFLEKERGRSLYRNPKETLIDFRSPTFDKYPRSAMYDPYGEQPGTGGRPNNGILTDSPIFSINPNRNSNALLLERDKMLKRTRDDVKRDSYPHSKNKMPVYQNIPIEIDPPGRYDHVPKDSPHNDIIIPPELRKGQPIQITVDLKGKDKHPGEYDPYKDAPHVPSHGYKDSDYGDNWDSSPTRPYHPSNQQQPLIVDRQRDQDHLQRKPDIGHGAGPNGGYPGSGKDQGHPPRPGTGHGTYPDQDYGPGGGQKPRYGHGPNDGDNDIGQGTRPNSVYGPGTGNFPQGQGTGTNQPYGPGSGNGKPNQPGAGTGGGSQPGYGPGTGGAGGQPGAGGNVQPGYGSGGAGSGSQPGYGPGGGHQPGYGPGAGGAGSGSQPGAGGNIQPGYGPGGAGSGNQPGYGPGGKQQPGYGPGAGGAASGSQPGAGGNIQPGYGPGAGGAGSGSQPGYGPGTGGRGQPGYGPGTASGQPGAGGNVQPGYGPGGAGAGSGGQPGSGGNVQSGYGQGTGQGTGQGAQYGPNAGGKGQGAGQGIGTGTQTGGQGGLHPGGIGQGTLPGQGGTVSRPTSQVFGGETGGNIEPYRRGEIQGYGQEPGQGGNQGAGQGGAGQGGAGQRPDGRNTRYGQFTTGGGVRTTTTVHGGGMLGYRDGQIRQTNDPRSPAPPPYNTRPYPITPGGHYREADIDVEFGQRQKLIRPIRGKSPKNQKVPKNLPKRKVTKVKTRKTTVTTRTTRRKSGTLCCNWSPSNCGNPRDCCLNIVFFVIIPIIIIAVILTIIFVAITASRNDDNYYKNGYYGNNYNNNNNYNNKYNNY